jgi:hypothetical protein
MGRFSNRARPRHDLSARPARSSRSVIEVCEEAPRLDPNTRSLPENSQIARPKAARKGVRARTHRHEE